MMNEFWYWEMRPRRDEFDDDGVSYVLTWVLYGAMTAAFVAGIGIVVGMIVAGFVLGLRGLL